MREAKVDLGASLIKDRTMPATAQNLMTQSDRDALEGQIMNVREDISDIKGSMGKVAEALTALAVLGEKHQTVAEATNKILLRIEKMEERQIVMDKREFAIADLARRVELAENKAGYAESRVKNLEDERNVQDGKIKGSTFVIRLLWTVLISSGLTAGAFALYLA